MREGLLHGDGCCCCWYVGMGKASKARRGQLELTYKTTCIAFSRRCRSRYCCCCGSLSYYRSHPSRSVTRPRLKLSKGFKLKGCWRSMIKLENIHFELVRVSCRGSSCYAARLFMRQARSSSARTRRAKRPSRLISPRTR